MKKAIQGVSVIQTAVIPANAGIRRSASARRIKHAGMLMEILSDSYARYRSRWIPAFAGMTAVFAEKV